MNDMYKVGDSVIVNPLLCTFDKNEEPIIVHEMLKYAGEEARIILFSPQFPERCQIDINSFWWNVKWLVPFVAKEFDIEENELYKLIGD